MWNRLMVVSSTIAGGLARAGCLMMASPPALTTAFTVFGCTHLSFLFAQFEHGTRLSHYTIGISTRRADLIASPLFAKGRTCLDSASLASDATLATLVMGPFPPFLVLIEGTCCPQKTFVIGHEDVVGTTLRVVGQILRHRLMGCGGLIGEGVREAVSPVVGFPTLAISHGMVCKRESPQLVM